ncbi:MAG: hypothetical protein ACOX1P_04075 [Thermoguttaceae bacterium]|jgi:hypothetical protein
MLTVSLLLAASLVVGQDAPSPVYEHLKELESFVGSWESKSVMPESSVDSEHLRKWAGKTVLNRMSVRWARDKSAQIIEEVTEIPGEIKITGTRLRGWDQAAKKITDHMFTTQKGVWSGVWDKRGGTWVAQYTGFNLDGKKCTGTRELRVIDKNTLVAKDLNQTVDGKPFPDVEYQYKRAISKAKISNYERLKGMEFFIGEWLARGNDGGTVRWTFAWTEGRNGIQNVLTGRGPDGEITFSNMGVFSWDPEDRRITNWCVTEKGKAVRFQWSKREDGKWETWSPGSTGTGVVTIEDDNTWRVEGFGDSLGFKRVRK